MTTNDRRVRVFVSSRMLELKAEREVVGRVLKEKLGIAPWIFEDDAGARTTTIRQTYLDELAKSHLYLGIFWNSWGEYTIEEFEHAKYKLHMDCLIYEKQATEGQREPKLQQFLDEIGSVKSASAVTIKRFADLDKLEQYLQEDIKGWLADKIHERTVARSDYRSQSPPLGDRYVERELVLKHLKERLLPSSDEGQSRVTRAVLCGPPGVGKTVTASAFAHDEEVMRAFPDGVLWLSLGENPDIKQHLTKLALTIPDPQFTEQAYSDLEVAVGRLRSLMRERAYLLVVDDVWVPDHVEKAFLIGGPRCLLLLTARNAQIASGVIGAEKVELTPMAEEEAVKLMSRWAGPISQTDEPIAHQLAREVGYLPLALELIGARVGALGSWSAYMERWRQQRLGALTRDRGSRGRKDSVRDSLELSLKFLSDDDRERYVRLGVFPRKALFPASAAATLWECDLFEAADLLIDLAGQAVLFQRKTEAGLRYGFHDLLYDLVLERMGRTGLLQAHGTLLEGYRRLGQAGWSSVADDGYFFDHLSYHMIQAERGDELIELLTGTPDWMNAGAATSGTDSSLALDVERALSLEPDVIEFVKLHAVKQVIRERLGWVSDTDLRTLVWRNRDAQALNQARLRPDPNRKFKSLIAVYEELRARGESRPELLDEAEAVAREIDAGSERADALRVLGTLRLSVADARWPAIFDRAREAANAAEEGMTQWKALLSIADALIDADHVKCKETLDNARAVAEQMTDDFNDRSAALRDIALGYARAGQADDALLTLKTHRSQGLGDAIQDVLLASYRAGTPLRMLSEQALAVIDHARKLSEQAFAYSHREGSIDTETLSLIACVHALNGEREAYNAVMSTWSEDDKSWNGSKAIRGLVLALAEAGDFEGADRELRTIHLTGDFASALDDTVCVANRKGYAGIDRVVSEAAPLILSKANLESDSKKFSPVILAGRLLIRVGKPRAALELIPPLTDEGMAVVLNELLPELDQIDVAGRITLLRQVRQQIKFSSEYWHESALRTIALALAKVRDESADSVLQRAWAAANSRATTYQPEGVLLNVADTFAAYGDAESCRKILGVLRNIPRRVGALCGLARYLFDRDDERHTEVLAEALELARAIERDEERARALIALVRLLGHINDPRWQSLAEEAEELAHSLSYPDFGLANLANRHPTASERLANLADCLAELKHFDEALRVADDIPALSVRGQRLAHIAMELSKTGDPRGDTILDEEKSLLFAVVESIRKGEPYDRDLEKDGRVLMYALVGAGRFDEAVEVARLPFREEKRSNMLAAFTRTLIQAERLDDAWEIGRSITLPAQRAEALVNLALALVRQGDARGRRLLDEVHELAQTPEHPYLKASVLFELVRGLAWTGELADAERTAETIPAPGYRAPAFREIADAVRESNPDRAGDLLRRALDEARAIPDAPGRQRLRATLIDTLASTQGLRRGFEMLETDSFDEFIGTLVRWAPLFEKLNREFPTNVLREVIAIAAWIRPGWQEVRDCL